MISNIESTGSIEATSIDNLKNLLIEINQNAIP